MRQRSVFIAIALGLSAAALPAQAPDARWLPWLGCWERVVVAQQLAPRLVCVIPDGEAALMVTVADGRALARERIVASGEDVPIDQDGCRGTERATWSADGRRLFRSAELSCEGGLRQTVSEMIAMTGNAEWINVQGAEVEGRSGLRVIRYRPAASAVLPDEIAAALAARPEGQEAARGAASSRVALADIVDAARLANPHVVHAWLAAQQHAFRLTGRAIDSLDRNGVPATTIDMLVAVSHPEVFGLQPDEPVEAESYGVTLAPSGSAYSGTAYDPYAVSAAANSPACASYRGRLVSRGDWCDSGPYLYGRYRGQYASDWAWTPQVAIVAPGEASDQAPPRGGRVVKDRGYVPGPGSTTSSVGTPRSSPAPSSREGSSGERGGAAGTPGSTSGRTTTSGERTAKPRP